jgi:hypothetical protein
LAKKGQSISFKILIKENAHHLLQLTYQYIKVLFSVGDGHDEDDDWSHVVFCVENWQFKTGL